MLNKNYFKKFNLEEKIFQMCIFIGPSVLEKFDLSKYPCLSFRFFVSNPFF
jgi:hypothetical protein